ncbi:Nramp family divalent metal transporter [Ningiella sp. W23]|uniref:Nramp family divalent metal transporter n=1 Tax=Ningiella sp. W23 TaxID=3023715 RepID=UPI003756F8C3
MRAAIKGIIVTAAFIGPGTITTASLVGAQLGYQLIWALVFAIFATCILQEMASRLGNVTGLGLSEAILSQYTSRAWKILATVLICTAIGIGNAAYEGGNLTGAALGLGASFGGNISHWALALGSLAALLILSNRYQLVEKVLVALVALMSLVFISLMWVAGINPDHLISGIRAEFGLFSNYALLLAIVGTTIVPYNLFLHAGMSARDKKDTASSHSTQTNLALFTSIGLGGLVTFAVMSSAASAFFASAVVMDKNNIATQLEPLLGDYAMWFFALGLFAAGLTSAITAPLAASFAISGLFDWRADLSDWRFKAVSLGIIACGVFVSVLGLNPFMLIIVAQGANALLLPISAVLLLIVCNNAHAMKAEKNSLLQNALGAMVIMVVLVLASYKLWSLI